MGRYIQLTKSNFDETVKEGVSMVLFWAPWCGPCRMILSTIEDLAEDYYGKAKICKLNTDEEQNIAIKYNVRSIPNIMFLKNGEVIDQTVGLQNKNKFVKKLDKLLEN